MINAFDLIDLIDCVKHIEAKAWLYQLEVLLKEPMPRAYTIIM